MAEVDQLAAFKATIALAEQRGMPEWPGTTAGLAHLRSMYDQARTGQFGEAKLGRWLGWAQCAVVTANIGVELEDMAEINSGHKRCAETESLRPRITVKPPEAVE